MTDQSDSLKNKIKRWPIFSGTIIAGFILIAVFAPFLSPHDPNGVNLGDNLLPPSWQTDGKADYILGTDMLGRDLLTRILYGARTSIIVATLAIFIGGGIGVFVGVYGGFKGGGTDTVLMRISDIVMSFPLIFIALLIAVSLGPSMINIVISICLVLWARYARVIRGEVLSLKKLGYIDLARVAGLSDWKIMWKHILPNILNTIVVMMTLQVGWVILVESIASFLGAGVPPPTPTWGTMVSRGKEYIQTGWWICFFPGAAIVAVVISFNSLGDWLREALDPKLRQSAGK